MKTVLCSATGEPALGDIIVVSWYDPNDTGRSDARCDVTHEGFTLADVVGKITEMIRKFDGMSAKPRSNKTDFVINCSDLMSHVRFRFDYAGAGSVKIEFEDIG